MIIIKGKWKYVLVKNSSLNKWQIEKLYNTKSWSFVELEIKEDEFFVLDHQKWSINKIDVWNKADIIDFDLLEE